MSMSDAFLPVDPEDRRDQTSDADALRQEADDLDLHPQTDAEVENEAYNAQREDESETAFRTPTPGDALTDGELEDDLRDES
jgi:hypothetical protein